MFGYFFIQYINTSFSVSPSACLLRSKTVYSKTWPPCIRLVIIHCWTRDCDGLPAFTKFSFYCQLPHVSLFGVALCVFHWFNLPPTCHIFSPQHVYDSTLLKMYSCMHLSFIIPVSVNNFRLVNFFKLLTLISILSHFPQAGYTKLLLTSHEGQGVCGITTLELLQTAGVWSRRLSIKQFTMSRDCM